jgi:hypothetical protein
MDISKAEKAKELLYEIYELNKVSSFIERTINKNFTISIMYFDGNKDQEVRFYPRHSSKFIPILEQIIEEVNNELSEL